MNNPEYVRIDNKKYKINSDFRVAIECNKIATDKNIGEYEKSLAIIYLLFGDGGLKDFYNHVKLLELGQKFLLCGGEPSKSKDEPDMDYKQDKRFIRSSFIQDYHYNPYDLDYLHWWDFYSDLNGLSNSEFGNCCVLNRVRNLRNCNVSEIKDQKEKMKILEAKKQVALKKDTKEMVLTEKQNESAKRFRKLMKGE